MSTVVDLTFEEPVDMDLTCTAPPVSTSSQQVMFMSGPCLFSSNSDTVQVLSQLVFPGSDPLYLVSLALLCSQIETPGGAEQQTMRVYLRVRPFSKEELCDNEDQVQFSI